MHILALVASLSHAYTLDSNLAVNPGFENGLTGWSNWTPQKTVAIHSHRQTGCRTGNGCVSQVNSGTSVDWATYSTQAFAVKPGEMYEWSGWVKLDSLGGTATLCFTTEDVNGNAITHTAFPVSILASTVGVWTQWTTRMTIPEGVSRLRPRYEGIGRVGLLIDDVSLRQVGAPLADTIALVLANDSLRVQVNPVNFGLMLRDSITGDTVSFEGVATLYADSSRRRGDTLQLFLTHVAEKWPLRMDFWLKGGSLRVRMDASPTQAMAKDLAFPGPARTRRGQWLAVPRSSGLAWPVDKDPGFSEFFEVKHWGSAVTQSIVGATDGKKGFVLSFDQPWDVWTRNIFGKDSLVRPHVFHAPSKGQWGHERSFLISPLRAKGWTEMAKRHRDRQAELGRRRTWTQKTQLNANMRKFQGASIFWFENLWPYVQGRHIDSMSWFGMNKAVMNWTWATASQVDTLNARGYLTSNYDNYSDIFPPGNDLFSIGYPDDAVVLPTGERMNWFAVTLQNGTKVQGLEACASQHAKSARQVVANERANKVNNNTRFVDVEMAMTQLECHSSLHPIDRAGDARGRLATMALLKDTLGLIIGSEHARDWASPYQDWAEGTMSTAVTKFQESGWIHPVESDSFLDAMSMSPYYRVPLFPLANHDAVAPTWHTGDGNAKIPTRWNHKDLWNALYGSPPLLMSDGIEGWNSQRVRFMRTVNLLTPLNERIGFEEMTHFEILSSDRLIQRTTYANGWTVTANFDSTKARTESGVSIAPLGFLAQGPGGERVERNTIAAGTRSRVYVSDRWFLDPENGAIVTVDGIRTGGSVVIRKTSDTTAILAMIGEQSAVDISSATLPFGATSIRVYQLPSGTQITPTIVDNGFLRLNRVSQGRFFRLEGDFKAISSVKPVSTSRPFLSLRKSGGGWIAQWGQETSGEVRGTILGVDGRTRARFTLEGRAGSNEFPLPHQSGIHFLQLETPDGPVSIRIPPLH